MKALTAEVVDTGQKRDLRGRRIVRGEEREALIAAYERSGMTQKAFAAREGVKFCTFTAWLSRRRRVAQPPKTAFAEVSVPIGTVTGLVEVVLPDGVVIRGGDAQRVAAIAAQLRRC